MTKSSTSFVERSTNGERLKPLSPSSREFWQTFSHEFQSKVLKFIQKSEARYLAGKKHGHPQIQFLENLGFQFTPEISVPELSEVMDRMEKNKGLTRLEIKFDLQLVNDSGWRWSGLLAFGEELPPGGKWTLARATPFQTNYEFYETLTQNIFPVSGLKAANNFVGDGGVSALEHDFAHISALFDSLPYREGLISAAKRMFSQAVNGNIFATVAHEFRVFFVSEGLVSVRPEQSPYITEYLEIPSARRTATVYELATELEKKSPKEIELLIKHYRQNIWRYLEPLGAAVRDLVSYTEFNGSLKQFPILHLLRKLDSHDLFTVAKFQRLVLNLAEADLGKLIASSYERRFTPGSAIDRLFRSGGFLDSVRDEGDTFIEFILSDRNTY